MPTESEIRTLIAHCDPSEGPLGHLASHPVLWGQLWELEGAEDGATLVLEVWLGGTLVARFRATDRLELYRAAQAGVPQEAADHDYEALLEWALGGLATLTQDDPGG